MNKRKRKQLETFQPKQPKRYGRHTMEAVYRYKLAETWEKLPDDYYFLMYEYKNSTVELNCAEKIIGKWVGMAYNYVWIVRELKMKKGHFCNLAEKCGCLKRGDIIYSDKKENIEALIEALLPWAMAARLTD